MGHPVRSAEYFSSCSYDDITYFMQIFPCHIYSEDIVELPVTLPRPQPAAAATSGCQGPWLGDDRNFMARNAEPILSRVESTDSDWEATQKIGVDWLTFANLRHDDDDDDKWHGPRAALRERANV